MGLHVPQPIQPPAARGQRRQLTRIYNQLQHTYSVKQACSHLENKIIFFCRFNHFEIIIFHGHEILWIDEDVHVRGHLNSWISDYFYF